MLENAPDQPNSNTYGYHPARASLQWMQQQLAEQGLTVSPEEAVKLFALKDLQDSKHWLQQDLAEHGIDVFPDEAAAIQLVHIMHRILERTGTTDPHEAT